MGKIPLLCNGSEFYDLQTMVFRDYLQDGVMSPCAQAEELLALNSDLGTTAQCQLSALSKRELLLVPL